MPVLLYSLRVNTSKLASLLYLVAADLTPPLRYGGASRAATERLHRSARLSQCGCSEITRYLKYLGACPGDLYSRPEGPRYLVDPGYVHEERFLTTPSTVIL